MDEFEIGQQVEVMTHLVGGVEQWEPATVHELRRPNLSDRFIEVEYLTGGVQSVLIERVRPNASDHLTPFQATADMVRDAVERKVKTEGWDLGQAHSYCFGSLTSAVDYSGGDPGTIRAISLGLQQGTARL
jgi:hypothetical protein